MVAGELRLVNVIAYSRPLEHEHLDRYRQHNSPEVFEGKVQLQPAIQIDLYLFENIIFKKVFKNDIAKMLTATCWSTPKLLRRKAAGCRCR